MIIENNDFQKREIKILKRSALDGKKFFCLCDVITYGIKTREKFPEIKNKITTLGKYNLKKDAEYHLTKIIKDRQF